MRIGPADIGNAERSRQQEELERRVHALGSPAGYVRLLLRGVVVSSR